MSLQVQEDSTETIIVYPPFESEWLYQASAADVRIGTPSTSMPDEGSEQTATVDPTDTTLSSAAARGAESLSVADGSDVVAGRVYVVVEDGVRTPVHVADKSGNTLFLASPIIEPLGSGAALQGLAATHALTSTETSESGWALAKWRLTLDGVQREFDQRFEIVEQVWRSTLTPQRLFRRREARRLRDPQDLTGLETISASWQDILRPRLRGAQIDENTLETPSELEPAHIEAAILLLKRDAGADDIEVQAQEERLDRALADVKRSVKFGVDEDSRDTPEPGNALLQDFNVVSFER